MRENRIPLSNKQVVRLAGRWIRDRRPGAIIRFGEGEGRLLVADRGDPESIRVASNKVRRQAGLAVSATQVLELKAVLMNTFDQADVLGIRGSDSFSEEHKMWVERIDGVLTERLAGGRMPARIAHSLVNNPLRDALGSLLANQELVSVISSRDLKATIKAEYGVPDVCVYQTPSQYVTRLVDGEYETAMHDVPIWPEFHDELYARLEVRERGEVFLIGAGLFGKDLCIRVRELGGIALDLGSCLDKMADKVTRGPNKPPPYEPRKSDSSVRDVKRRRRLVPRRRGRRGGRGRRTRPR